MIIGSGFIANSFRKSNFNTKDYIIFASGVSNSKEDKSKNFEREVKPHLPESFMDRSKDSIGYEINFTKYFYQYKPLRSLEDLTKELLKLEKESDGLMNKLIG